MTGASYAAPHGRCHHKKERGEDRAFFPEVLAMMGRGRGFGPGPGGPGFGPAGGPHHRGRGGRPAPRGDIRSAILLLLADEPRNGYGLMQEIEERSGGVWRPSPGSVYPALSQLEDEGLVKAEERDGRRTYVLTDAGRTYVDDRRDELVAPWDEMSESGDDDVAA